MIQFLIQYPPDFFVSITRPEEMFSENLMLVIYQDIPAPDDEKTNAVALTGEKLYADYMHFKRWFNELITIMLNF